MGIEYQITPAELNVLEEKAGNLIKNRENEINIDFILSTKAFEEFNNLVNFKNAHYVIKALITRIRELEKIT